jgi:carbonic anhydrase/acetyltransferase-like protein (isoleucine patch superfamily)
VPLLPFKKASPHAPESCFIAPDAWVIGDVVLGEEVSVFFGAVLRGDILAIKVGAGTNIQEHAVLHTSHGLAPCLVGDSVTVGHRSILHGCTVADRCIIGMGAVVLDGAEIGPESIVGAQSLVPMNFKAPPRSMIRGVPARVVRSLTDDEVASLPLSAEHYVAAGQEYRKLLNAR